MFKYLLALAVLLGAKAEAAPILDEDDQFQLLQSIDSICGDTWCEGDANWSFDTINCDTDSGCVLNLTMMPYDFTDDVTLSERRLQCELPDFIERSAIVEKTNRGLQYTPGLYEAVSDCIYDLTDNFGPMYVPVDSSCRALFNSERAVSHTVQLKGKPEGLDAALQALNVLVGERAKTDSSCLLETLPYYRDRASCKFTQVNEICSIPTINGYFRVRRNLETSRTTIRYSPVKK
ncbi:MAG: hypothetical protein V4655_01150 [Bdellovibrionota bacterium]|nr:MAG: hypothetical protein EOP10_12385 [Pseudomonadota bacterium]